MALFSGFRTSSLWRETLANHRSFQRERAFLLAVHSTEAAMNEQYTTRCFQKHLVVYSLAVKWENLLRRVGSAWYFLNWSQHGCWVTNFLKQYTTRCFWKHFMREIGITVTEYWFIFDQCCLVWPLDRSSRVIDSCSETVRLQLGSDWLFSSGLWNLADAIRSTRGHRGTWFCSNYLSYALLSG